MSSNRAKQASLKAYPDPPFEGYSDDPIWDQEQSMAASKRSAFEEGYDIGASETLERITEWLKQNLEVPFRSHTLTAELLVKQMKDEIEK